MHPSVHHLRWSHRTPKSHNPLEAEAEVKPKNAVDGTAARSGATEKLVEDSGQLKTLQTKLQALKQELRVEKERKVRELLLLQRACVRAKTVISKCWQNAHATTHHNLDSVLMDAVATSRIIVSC